MQSSTLLAVPNVSEGRDAVLIAELAGAFAGGGSSGVRLLDVHSDPHHHRSVFTLAGEPAALVEALMRGARLASARIDVIARARAVEGQRGQHPHVGSLDVAPLVHLSDDLRGLACAHALVLGERIGEELGVPVFVYGELTAERAPAAGGGGGRTRAELRRGGVLELASRIERGELTPDFGPAHAHPRAGVTLVAARPPLVAFNLVLAPPAGMQRAREVASAIREGGAEGMPGLRAIAVELERGLAQVSMNVEQPLELPLAHVVAAVRAHAEVQSAELVGLAPAAALAEFPADVEIVGFDSARQLIENALRC